MLKHLNQVLNICFLLTASPQSEDHLHIPEKPIRCHAIAEWSRLLQQDSLKLTCILENSSPYAFEQGWTLSVNVFPLSRPPSEGGENTSRNFSFPFHSIHPGETLEVALPLANAGDASFPVTASCSLIFSFSTLLGEEAADLPESQRSFTLPLNTLTVDWLHALQLSSGPVTHKKAASQCRGSTTAGVHQALLRLCQIRGGGRGERGEAALKPEPEQFSASVRLSSDLIKGTLTSDSLGGKSAHQHVCLSLLQWLLAEGFGEVRAGRRREEISSPAVQAQCPDGHSVKLTAEEVKLLNSIQMVVFAVVVCIKQVLCFAGGFRRRGRGEGGVSAHGDGSHRELVHSSSMWAAPRSAAPRAGTHTRTRLWLFKGLKKKQA